MNDYTIDYNDNSLEVQTGFGNVKFDLGRPATVADATKIEDIMNLGARIYAEKIRRARIEVDDLIHWRKR